MGAWGIYFLVKLYLYFRGYLGFHLALNAAFAVGLSAGVPWAAGLAPARRRSFHAAAAVLAVAVLWQDSFLPPFLHVVAFLRDPHTRPTGAYIVEFLQGYWQPLEWTALAAIAGLGWEAVRRKARLTPLIIVLLGVVAVRDLYDRPRGGTQDLAEATGEGRSKARSVAFPTPAKGAAPFDILILHVCSLSWDDLEGLGLDDSPFLGRFDALLERFNTATSYSNPAALRLLRANCGQTAHSALYQKPPDECLLLERLRGAGFKTYAVFNHDGTYGDMGVELRRLAGADVPILPEGLPARAKGFDGGSIYGDFDVLEAWWKKRQADGAPRAALYYNSVTLHDGAHGVDDRQWWKRPRIDKYREFLEALSADVERFVGLVEASGRRALVVFVPEHGAALRGSSLQPVGLRDIPLPTITEVPVGLRLVAPGRAPAPQQRLDAPLSYLGLARLLGGAIGGELSWSGAPVPAGLEAALPRSRFIAENEHSAVLERGGEFLHRDKSGKWARLPRAQWPRSARDAAEAAR